MKHANAIGVWGHAPRKILKNRCSEIEFGDISVSIIVKIWMHVAIRNVSVVKLFMSQYCMIYLTKDEASKL